jgi:CubicO group peptidase (beta-lactamase class C family)
MANGTRALVIQMNGQVLVERYGGVGRADRAEFLASGTKSFSCALAAAAEDQGLINLDEPASTVIASWRPGGGAPDSASKQLIRARDLIALSHGLSAAGASGNGLNDVDSYAQAISVRSLFAPDTAAIYSANGFQAFNAYFELKTGGTLNANGDLTGGLDPVAYLESRVLTPIGSRPGGWARDIKGKPNFGGGASFTALDWMRYGQFILQDGRWGATQVVSAARIARCGTYRSPAFEGYGLGFWLNRPVGATYNPSQDDLALDSATLARLTAGGKIVPSAPDDTMIAWGAGNMKMFVIKSRGLVVVKLSGTADDSEFFTRLFSAT